MVRVVDSHHRLNFGQIEPAMYPYLKKFTGDIRTNFNQPQEEMMSTEKADYITKSTSNGNSRNMPNFELLGREVIDADAAHRAAGAVRCYASSNENYKNCIEDETNDSDVEVMRDSYVDADRMCGNDHEVPAFSILDHPRCRHNSAADTESDCTDSTQLSENCTDPKERRRQRNKLSARAYRDRKRTLAQEQGQTLATLEAEQTYLREKMRKLQEEKRDFLKYLKYEMNIDIPNSDSDEALCTPANDS